MLKFVSCITFLCICYEHVKSYVEKTRISCSAAVQSVLKSEHISPHFIVHFQEQNYFAQYLKVLSIQHNWNFHTRYTLKVSQVQWNVDHLFTWLERKISESLLMILEINDVKNWFIFSIKVSIQKVKMVLDST